ncbi:MAG: hypothetical protein AB3N16_12805 [Flavobacteriaceae bacterium]
MQRKELFEFEDQNWFPSWLRACLTRLIIVLQNGMGIPKVLAGELEGFLLVLGENTLVDLGSGAGGILPQVVEMIHGKKTIKGIQLLLTDKYPDPMVVQRTNTDNNGWVRYKRERLDAEDLALAPKGLKTMMNSFHHMEPTKAQNILASAQKSHNAIYIYEMAGGKVKVPFWAWVFLLPLSLTLLMVMVLFMTPFVSPLTWQQVVFTYLIPIIPITYAWDGQASLPRMYTFADLEAILPEKTAHYQWEYGNVTNENGKKMGIFLKGCPMNTHKNNTHGNSRKD